MARQRLHSLTTFPLKFILPVFWAFLLGKAFLRLRAEHAMPSVGFLMFCVVTCALVARVSYGTKKVYRDERTLYVSDYLQEIAVPLDEIERVSQAPLTNSTVTVHFRRPTDFGRSIRFLPKIRPHNTLAQHPVVEELNYAAHCKLVAG